MNELALFAGAGGGILGGKLLGWRTVCAVEWESYPASVLCARQNDKILAPFPIWDDVRTFDGKPWQGIVDVVSGGFPCQDISAAGGGAGICGSRSGLWSEMARIIGEVRPRYAFVENSPMLTSRGLGTVLGDLASLGFDARWGVVSAADVGAPHLRERIWIVAKFPDTNGDGCNSILQRQSRRKGETQCATVAFSNQWGSDDRQSLGNSGQITGNGDAFCGREAAEKTSIISNTSEIRKQWKPSIQTNRCSGGIIREKNAEITKESPQIGGVQELAEPEKLQYVGNTESPRLTPCAERQGQRQSWGASIGFAQWWETEPNVDRVVDGLASRVDRLKAIGNGQVPAVAATAFKLLAGAF